MINDTSDPGIIVNEVISEDERDCIIDITMSLHPIPQLLPRSRKLVENDLFFLENVLGLSKCISDRVIHYFFDMIDINKYRNIRNIKGPYKTSYKYFGIDDETAYIFLCIEDRID